MTGHSSIGEHGPWTLGPNVAPSCINSTLPEVLFKYRHPPKSGSDECWRSSSIKKSLLNVVAIDGEDVDGLGPGPVYGEWVGMING